MTEIVYYVAASLDGFIAGPQGELEWLMPFENAATDYGMAAFIDTVDAVVMGRRTCEAVMSFGVWPYGERPGQVLSHQPRPSARGLPQHMEWGPAHPSNCLHTGNARACAAAGCWAEATQPGSFCAAAACIA